MARHFIDLGGTDNTITPIPADDNYFITGGNGNNTVTLGNGSDLFTLGDGNNTLTVGNGACQFMLGDGNNTVTTGNGNSNITVGNGNDTVTVGTGSNVIALGTGLNTVHTGAGKNTVFVSAAALTGATIMGALTSLDGSTNKLVLTTAGTMNPVNVSGFQSYRLANGGPNSLTLVEANFARLPGGSITVFGGDSGNTVNASVLSAAHAVIVFGGAGTDKLAGGAGNDTLIGGAGNDTLTGGGGNDFLIGGTGADRMIGGAGNDLYSVDNAADRVIEAASGGTDRVLASVSYTLQAGQEIEILSTNNAAGTTPLNLTGNEFANTITGNAGANVLNGRAGNDVLHGLAGNDRMIGGTGADRMIGGDGDDTYIVDNAADRVIESVGGGIDRVIASVSYALQAGQAIEILSTNNAAGTTALNLTGNEFANTIQGNAGNNVLRGGAGNDVLRGLAGNDRMIGGTGNDRLYGGAGHDAFVFNTPLDTATNVDRIFDFSTIDDRILLSGSVFTALGAPGPLAPSEFFIGAGAHDASDRIIYNSTTGALTYDPDGTGAASATRFAAVSTSLALTNADFLII